MSEICHLTEPEFTAYIENSPIPVMAEFGSDCCEPCKRLEPILSLMVDEWAGKVELVQVYVDECSEVTQKYNVLGIPTVILFLEGKPVQRFTGMQPRQKIYNLFKPFI
jgi:thioredoxin 1